MNIAKFLRTGFFIEHLRWMLLVEAIKQRISRNTASKFRRQHAAQFDFCRYEGLCPATKTEIHREFAKF